jgi:hypothetical protein
MHEHAPGLSKEELTKRAFDWAMEGFTHEEARQWLDAGAMGYDLRVCAEFKRAGIPASLAFRPMPKRGRPTDETVFDLVSSRSITIKQARDFVERSRTA